MPLWLSLTPTLISIQQNLSLLPRVQAPGNVFRAFFCFLWGCFFSIPLSPAQHGVCALICTHPWGEWNNEVDLFRSVMPSLGDDTARGYRHLVCLKEKWKTALLHNPFPLTLPRPSMWRKTAADQQLAAALPYRPYLHHQSAHSSGEEEGSGEIHTNCNIFPHLTIKATVQ